LLYKFAIAFLLAGLLYVFLQALILQSLPAMAVTK